MSKRNKQKTSAASDQSLGGSALATRHCHPPAKQPTLLAISLTLFALWFAFLLVTALLG
jgi:hypothetical protein